MAASKVLPLDLPSWNRVLRDALSIPLAALKMPKHFEMYSLTTPQQRIPLPRAPASIKAESAVLVLLAPVSPQCPCASSPGCVPMMDLAMPLTLRCATMRAHSGQMAFPGGRCEDGETPFQTAARETVEEIGIPPEAYTEIGQLSRVWSLPSKSWVTPVVALAHAPVAAKVCSVTEVSSVHQLHLSWFLFNSHLSHMCLQKYWTYRANVAVRIPCTATSSHSFEIRSESLNCGAPPAKAEGSPGVPLAEGLPHNEQLVWGLTDIILCEFAMRLAHVLHVPLVPSNIELLDWEAPPEPKKQGNEGSETTTLTNEAPPSDKKNTNGDTDGNSSSAPQWQRGHY